MINLIAGGRSVLNLKVEGLKVYINYAFKYFDDIDILIWGDIKVGDSLYCYYGETKPGFKTVCHRTNGGLYKRFVDEFFEFGEGTFTLIWALLWLKEKYPNEEIIIHGLDGDAISYYDTEIEQPKTEKRIEALKRCYAELDKIKNRKNIYITNGSAYKGFPEFQ